MSKVLIGCLDFRARGQRMITPVTVKVHDELTFNVIGATMAYYNLTFNMIGATMSYYNLTFNVIGATMESPSQNPPARLYKPRVCSNKVELLRQSACPVWLSLSRQGAG